MLLLSVGVAPTEIDWYGICFRVSEQWYLVRPYEAQSG